MGSRTEGFGDKRRDRWREKRGLSIEGTENKKGLRLTVDWQDRGWGQEVKSKG